MVQIFVENTKNQQSDNILEVSHLKKYFPIKGGMFGKQVGAVKAVDDVSFRPGARRETIETYTNRLKQLEDITNQFKGVDKSFAIQAGREIRVMVVPEQVSDDDMVLLARDIAKQIESELEYPGQIKVNVIRESRATDYAK